MYSQTHSQRTVLCAPRISSKSGIPTVSQVYIKPKLFTFCIQFRLIVLCVWCFLVSTNCSRKSKAQNSVQIVGVYKFVVFSRTFLFCVVFAHMWFNFNFLFSFVITLEKFLKKRYKFKYIKSKMQGKMVQLTCAVILCLSLFGQSVIAKPGYASGYDVDYYVSAVIIRWIYKIKSFVNCYWVSEKLKMKFENGSKSWARKGINIKNNCLNFQHPMKLCSMWIDRTMIRKQFIHIVIMSALRPPIAISN